MINKIKDLKLAIIGLGYVGLPLALEFGKKREVICFDINKKRIEELDKGIDKNLEFNKKELRKLKQLNFTYIEEDLKSANCFIITVPTPIDKFKRPNLSPLLNATEMISKIIKKGDLIIYESTVYPGCVEEECVPILEKFSKLKFNQDFFCGYSPERINPGDKVNTITKIKKITSGSTPEIAEEIDKLYQSIITAGTFKASSIKVAEAAKVIENTQRDLNIALVNELSVIFGRLNLDTLDVLEAAGSKWNFLPFRPGLVGGHCIGVDPYYLTHAAEQVRYNPQVILAGRRINDNMALYLVKKVVQNMTVNGINLKTSTVGVMGITFKENCPDIRNSKILDIIDELKNWGINVIVDDPWADPQEVKSLHGINIETISSKNQVDALIVGVGHDEYRLKSAEELKSYCKGPNPVIADVKSIYNKQELKDQGFSVFRL